MEKNIKNFMVGEDEGTLQQIAAIADSPSYRDSKIRIMPDAHVGVASCIGFTATFSDKICPNTVGVDIGCRVSTRKLISKINLVDLDEAIHKVIPAGMSVREAEHEFSKAFPYEELYCWEHLSKHQRLRKSMGTLGGGNHYIEVNENDRGEQFLSIHCGSRNLGKQVAEYYQELAKEEYIEHRRERFNERYRKMKELDPRDREEFLMNHALEEEEINFDFLYVSGMNLEHYLHDVDLCQRWSKENHMAIYDEIAAVMGCEYEYLITTIHNYVDVKHKIVRKGAISGYKGELQLIPLNMRDGMLMVEALGNEDWNCSLPHGAGRLMSRHKARQQLSLEDYENEMKNVYSTSVVMSTIDEAPMAYKNTEQIKSAIGKNAKILGQLYPVYNFKAKGE
jgi:tRNA-splicing ligase RtcB